MRDSVWASFAEYEKLRQEQSDNPRRVSQVSTWVPAEEAAPAESGPTIVHRESAWDGDHGQLGNFHDVPDMVGDFFRSGGASAVTFRPVATFPPNATGTVVRDAASNRLVYIDATDTLLVPGNALLVNPFLLFRTPGGGLLTQTTNAQGLTGYFGVERLATDPSVPSTIIDSPFDVLLEPGTQNIVDPNTGVMGTSPPYSARLSLVTQIASDPSAGNTGLSRIAAGSSPIPRDRLFFHNSFFDNVPLANNGISVNRFVPGLESLLDDEGNLSVELRFPFAATLDSDFNINSGVNTNEVEFGNISVALKKVIAKNHQWLMSAGVQVVLPTASDLSLQVSDLGVTGEFLRIENESVHVMPFIGTVYAPDDRFFMQTFLQVDADANGKPVLANPNVLNGGLASQVGRLNSAAFVYADISMGYWMAKEPTSSLRTLTGFAPLLELHYMRNINDTDSVSFLPLGSIGSGQDIETLSATMAGVFEFNHNSQMTVGYSVPLAGGSDEPFDGELRVMFSRRFGQGSAN